MNIRARIPEVVTGCHYVLTEDDFITGFISETAEGRFINGITKRLGLRVQAQLDVNLCDGCDQPIPTSAYCDRCECIHADLGGPVTDLGNGRMGVML